MMKKDSVKYKISPHGKKKLDFPNKAAKASVRLPLIGKTVYLDVKEPKHLRRLKQDLKTLGATIEEFVSKDINYLITSQQRPKTCKVSDPQGSSPAPSPFNCDPSPSPANNEDRRATSVTRGKALLEKARTKNRETNTLLDNAERWGVKIVPLEGAFRWIDKELRKLPKSSQNHKKSLRSKCVAKYKTIKTPYLKIENTSCHYRPFSQELETWPHLNIDTPRGSCPFDGTIINRGSISQEERGDILPAQVDIPSADTPNEEKDEMDSNQIANNKDSQKTGKTGDGDLSNYGNILTAGELRKRREAKKRLERKRGYCECCRVKYEDLDKHVRDDSHKGYVRTKSHYMTLDSLIGSGPSTTSFLQTYLMLAVKHARKGTAQPTQQHINDDEIVLISPAKSEPRQSPRKRSKSANTPIHDADIKTETVQSITPNVLKETDILNRVAASTACETDKEQSSYTSRKSPRKRLEVSGEDVKKIDSPVKRTTKDNTSMQESIKHISKVSPVMSGNEEARETRSPRHIEKSVTPHKNINADSLCKVDKENEHDKCSSNKKLTFASKVKNPYSLQDEGTISNRKRAVRKTNITDEKAKPCEIDERSQQEIKTPKKPTDLSNSPVVSERKRSGSRSGSVGKQSKKSHAGTDKDKCSEDENNTINTIKDKQDLIEGKRTTIFHSSDDFEKCLAKELNITSNNIGNQSCKKQATEAKCSTQTDKTDESRKSKTGGEKSNSECYSDIPSDFQCMTSTGEVLNFSKTLAERIKDRSGCRRSSVATYNLNKMFSPGGSLSKKSRNQLLNLSENLVKTCASVASAKVLNKYKNQRFAKSAKSEVVNAGYQGDDEQEGGQQTSGTGEGKKGQEKVSTRRKKHCHGPLKSNCRSTLVENSRSSPYLSRELANLSDTSLVVNSSRIRSRIQAEECKPKAKMDTFKEKCYLKDSSTKSIVSKKDTTVPNKPNIWDNKKVKKTKRKQFWEYVVENDKSDKEDSEKQLNSLPKELKMLKSSWNPLSNVSTCSDSETERDGQRSRQRRGCQKVCNYNEDKANISGDEIENQQEITDYITDRGIHAINKVVKNPKKGKTSKKQFWTFVAEDIESEPEHLKTLPRALRYLKTSWNHVSEISSSEMDHDEQRKSRPSRRSAPGHDQNGPDFAVGACKTVDLASLKIRERGIKESNAVNEKACHEKISTLKFKDDPSSLQSEKNSQSSNTSRNRSLSTCYGESDSNKPVGADNCAALPSNASSFGSSVEESESVEYVRKVSKKKKNHWEYVPIISPEKQEVVNLPRELAILKDAWSDMGTMARNKRRASPGNSSFLSDSELVLQSKTLKKKLIDTSTNKLQLRVVKHSNLVRTAPKVSKNILKKKKNDSKDSGTSIFLSQELKNLKGGLISDFMTEKSTKRRSVTPGQYLEHDSDEIDETEDNDADFNTAGEITKPEDISKHVSDCKTVDDKIDIKENRNRIEKDKEFTMGNVMSDSEVRKKAVCKYWDYVVEPEVDEPEPVDQSLPKELRYLLQAASLPSTSSRRRSSTQSTPASDLTPVSNICKKRDSSITKKTKGQNVKSSIKETISELESAPVCNEIDVVVIDESNSMGKDTLYDNCQNVVTSTPPHKRKRTSSFIDTASQSPVFKSSKLDRESQVSTDQCYFSQDRLKSPSSKRRKNEQIQALPARSKSVRKEECLPANSIKPCTNDETENLIDNLTTTPVKEKVMFTPQSGYSGPARDWQRKQWKRKKSSSPVGQSSTILSHKQEKKRKKMEKLQCQGEGLNSTDASEQVSASPSKEETEHNVNKGEEHTEIQNVSQSSEIVSLKWEPVKLQNAEKAETRKVKLNKSWSLLSDRSVEKLLSNDDEEEGSFDGFTDKEDGEHNKSVRSDLSFEECNEVELDNNSDYEWVVGDKADEENDEKENSPEVFDKFLMFSSPGKPSESSWMDACDSYINKSLNKSQVADGNKSTYLSCVTSPLKSPQHTYRVSNLTVTPTKGFSSPVRSGHHGTSDKGVVKRIDNDIEFNFGSPQKDKSCYSPLRVKNGQVVDISSPLRCHNVTSTPSKEEKKLKKKKKHARKIYDGLVFSGDEALNSDSEKSKKNEFKLLKKVSTVPKNFEIKYEASPPKIKKKKKISP